jgi:hypothetical protein
MTDEMHAPPRLVQTVGPAGDCLREALAERESTRVPPRFAALQERRLQRVRRQRALALLALVAVAGSGAHFFQREDPRPNISAELTVSASPPSRVAAVSSPSELPVAPEAPPRQVPAKTSKAPAAPKPTAARASVDAAASLNDSPPLDATKPTNDVPEGGGSAKVCAQLARAGSAEQARDCYERLSSGSGMSAELALFEQARLEGKALRRPESALLTLEAHRRRFPRGSLRAEVMLAQIDWLLATGDSAHALQVVDEALASGLLSERTSELQRLRTTLAPANNP